MKYVRKVVNSKELAGIIDISEELKNKKVELIVLPYKDENDQGALTLQKKIFKKSSWIMEKIYAKRGKKQR